MPHLPIRYFSAALLLALTLLTAHATPPSFNVRDFGAKGDGANVDTDAINRAIAAAAAQGGGTVHFPAGTYLSFSIRLKSNLTLELGAGATILAASPESHGGRYDPPEPNEWGDRGYQDFGHSHWQNSLIWGEGIENVSIVGPGRIHGKGLVRGGGRPRRTAGETKDGAAANPRTTAPGPYTATEGSANKAIALKNCRNVTLRDFSVLEGGWFVLLATGVDNLTIDNLTVDTNRDGFDIDACRNVRVSNCVVNAPNDDAIVLKSSYGLGEKRACENVTITNCQVSGFDVGSVLAGTFQRTQPNAPDRDGPTGRIKFGTESNGGFKNITISNCTFVRSRGLAIETVDGGAIEDVTVTNLTMREVSNSPIFIRLGNRARGPEGTPVATVRRINISNVIASDVDPRYPIIIAGLPGHPIREVRLSNIQVVYRGGVTMEQVAQQPADMINTFFLRGPGLTGPRDPYQPPENEKGYPEPSMFGLLPAYGLFARHVEHLDLEGIRITSEQPDERAPLVLIDVADVSLSRVDTQARGDGKRLEARDVRGLTTTSVRGMPDAARSAVESASL